MKMKHVRLEMNDDGTIQIECCADGFSVGKMKSYSAKNLSEVAGKIEEAQKEFASEKEEKKGKSKLDEFMSGASKEDDDA